MRHDDYVKCSADATKSFEIYSDKFVHVGVTSDLDKHALIPSNTFSSIT